MDYPTINPDVLAETIQNLTISAALGGRPSGDIQLGDIVYLQSGYNETNVTYYVVLRRTKKTVVMQPLWGKYFPEYYAPPAENQLLPGVIREEAPNVRAWIVSDEEDLGDEIMLKYKNAYGWKWDGKPKTVSPIGLN